MAINRCRTRACMCGDSFIQIGNEKKCPICREILNDISKLRKELKKRKQKNHNKLNISLEEQLKKYKSII